MEHNPLICVVINNSKKKIRIGLDTTLSSLRSQINIQPDDCFIDSSESSRGGKPVTIDLDNEQDFTVEEIINSKRTIYIERKTSQLTNDNILMSSNNSTCSIKSRKVQSYVKDNVPNNPIDFDFNLSKQKSSSSQDSILWHLERGNEEQIHKNDQVFDQISLTSYDYNKQNENAQEIFDQQINTIHIKNQNLQEFNHLPSPILASSTSPSLNYEFNLNKPDLNDSEDSVLQEFRTSKKIENDAININSIDQIRKNQSINNQMRDEKESQDKINQMSLQNVDQLGIHKQNLQQQSQANFSSQKQGSENRNDFEFSKKLFEHTMLVIGLTGYGKSSFIKTIVNDSKIEIGHTSQSQTKKCTEYTSPSGYRIIDTPGFDDTYGLSNNQILLLIVKYLIKSPEFNEFENLFIIFIEKKSCKRDNSFIRDLAFVFFLVKLIGEEIQLDKVDKLTEHFIQTNEYLHLVFENNSNDPDIEKEKNILLQNKDKILNLKEKLMNYHLIVRTHFDEENQKDVFESILTENAFLQIWVNIQGINLGVYNDHIKNQQNFLFNKIADIIKREQEIENEMENSSIENILLIGKSKTGKSSLIEQLTKLKGLRGTGQLSFTEYCKIHHITDENVKYRFIDPPGHQSSNGKENEFHNMKVLVDFMRRKQIFNFRIIFLNREKKQISPKVFESFFFFIVKYLDQDVTRILERQIEFEIRNTLLSEEILQLLRFQSLSVRLEMFNDIDEVKVERHRYQNFFFQDKQQNYFELKFATSSSENENINSEIDAFQIRLLFDAIKNLKSLTLEDIISHKVYQFNNARVIEESDEALNPILEELLDLCKKILKLGEPEITQEQRLSAQIQINSKIYLVMSDKWNKICSFLFNISKSNQIDQNSMCEMRKMFYRRFLIVSFPPILFECDKNDPKVLLSRKQMYYNQLQNQLIEFKNYVNDQFFIEMSTHMVKSELMLQWHLFQKVVDDNYYQLEFKKESETGLELIGALNMIQGAGVQIYRYATYFNKLKPYLQQAQNAGKIGNIVSSLAPSIISAISFGRDLYYFQSGKIQQKQFVLNTGFNALGIASLILGQLLPGFGLISIGIGIASCIGQGLSEFKYTSSSTFDETIRLSFLDMVDDKLDNQSLQIFQRNRILRDEFKITQPSDFGSSVGYDAYRKLEEDKVQSQMNLLSKLHKVEQDKVIDVVANYIMKKYILQKFNQIPIKNEIISISHYFNQINPLFELNNQQLDVFFSNHELSNQIKIYQKTIIDQIDGLKSFDIQLNYFISQYNQNLIWIQSFLSVEKYNQRDLEKLSISTKVKSKQVIDLLRTYSLKTRISTKLKQIPKKKESDLLSAFQNNYESLQESNQQIFKELLRQFNPIRQKNILENYTKQIQTFLDSKNEKAESQIETIQKYNDELNDISEFLSQQKYSNFELEELEKFNLKNSFRGDLNCTIETKISIKFDVIPSKLENINQQNFKSQCKNAIQNNQSLLQIFLNRINPMLLKNKIDSTSNDILKIIGSKNYQSEEIIVNNLNIGFSQLAKELEKYEFSESQLLQLTKFHNIENNEIPTSNKTKLINISSQIKNLPKRNKDEDLKLYLQQFNQLFQQNQNQIQKFLSILNPFDLDNLSLLIQFLNQFVNDNKNKEKLDEKIKLYNNQLNELKYILSESKLPQDELDQLAKSLFIDNKTANLIVSDYTLKLNISSNLSIIQQNEGFITKQFSESLRKDLLSNQFALQEFVKRFNPSDETKFTDIYQIVSNKIKSKLEDGQTSNKNLNILINNYNETLDKLIELQLDEKLTKKKFDELCRGYFRKSDRFNILFKSYSNLMDLKTQYIYSSQQLIEEINQDKIQRCFTFSPTADFKSLFQSSSKKPISVIDDFLVRQYCSSRYLNKFEGTDFYQFTSLSLEDLFGVQPKESIDLHKIAKNSQNLSEFEDYFLNKINEKSLHKKAELVDRARIFYKAFKHLESYETQFQLNI